MQTQDNLRLDYSRTSLCLYICVLISLYMCTHTSICRHKATRGSTTASHHSASIYVCSYLYICVLIPLYADTRQPAARLQPHITSRASRPAKLFGIQFTCLLVLSYSVYLLTSTKVQILTPEEQRARTSPLNI